MPPAPSRTAVTTNHPGSTQQEIDDEPEWGFGHNHRIGYVNSDDRYPGFTHQDDNNVDYEEYEEAKEGIEGTVEDEMKKHEGQLINFRQVMQDKTDVHLKRKEDHPAGWRFYVNVTEDWVKKEQKWPANIKAEQKRKQKEKEQKEKNGEKDDKQKDQKQTPPQNGGKKDDGPSQSKDKEGGRQGGQKKEDSAHTDEKKPQSNDEKPAESKEKDDKSGPAKQDSKEDAAHTDEQKPQSNDEKPADSEEKDDKSNSAKQDSNPTQDNSNQQESNDKQESTTSDAPQDKSSQSKKSKGAHEAEAKHPGGANEDHTQQRGQSHYWQNGDSDESDWRRGKDDSRPAHNAAFRRLSSADSDEGYHSGDKSDDEKSKNEDHKTEYQKLREKYSPEEIALLRHLQNEAKYASELKQNDGKQISPVADSKQLIEIDVNDQFTPDNWIPRSTQLTRLTGKHPLNAEAPLTKLFEAGLITPNELHYVRNHGAVPRLYWETHTLDVEDGSLVLTMDELADFPSINIAVALGCDGNRRGEVNLVKKSKGFSWGASGISCAYWKGALLRDVLLAAGVDSRLESGKRTWVNFEGADELTDGKYATCIPLEYALDPGNDVIIAYEMNNVKLPPDHGFPIRLLIPGWVGGRCVKWLARIWTSDEENDSHYHIWDNRVLPSFVTEKDGPFAEAMFKHPSTVCNEQNLNSVIVKPAQGEKLSFKDAAGMDTYRVEGYAYDGGGHEIQRVELSIDEGKTWLYCTRRFPEFPVRHGSKYWCWLHWYIDVDMGHLLQASSIVVRAMNVFKNFQPEKLTWNVMGMMNNSWYKVVHELVDSTPFKKEREASILFRHPIDPENNEGWMKPSLEVQLNAAKADTGVPDKQFTRQEIEKHNTDSDCWIVVNSKVYDATSVLDWHPGGKASILGYAGKLTAETTSSFESIHDDYAAKKLSECIIGKLTDKAGNFIKQQAKHQAEERAKSSSNSDVFLKKQVWQPVKLIDRKKISEDTGSYTFQIPDKSKRLGMKTCQHIQFGFHMKDKLLIRSYTPTRPILTNDEDGTFELVVKIYFPNDQQPGGAFSNFIDTMPLGESVDVRGPTGEIKYLGNGKFEIEGEERKFDKVSLILGGSGITPGYQLLERVMREKDDKTQIRVVDANKSEKDILLKDELEKMQGDQIKITHVLSHPSDEWKGLKGHVNEEIIKKNCFAPEEGAAVFLCGPPPMIQKAALPALKDWGYEEDVNCFGF